MRKEDRWLTIAIAATAGLIGGMLSTWLVGGATAYARNTHKVVHAEQFVVKDSAGRIRATLGVEDDGGVGLVIRDRNGTERASLGMDSELIVNLDDWPVDLFPAVPRPMPGTVRLRLSDRKGTTGANIRVSTDGVAVLTFLNEQGMPTMLLAGGATEPHLAAWDEKVRETWPR